ncbi:SEPT3 [Cervus elaphus hippelaphus]|uniref:SEPT3 n=1 Tax=Cervus elaphus hippelaphus TaxID=46360 RepID=A0A212CD03_CEREH|nr:SEPT3 [Cervus elaphus hippelaphus]
MSELVPEPRPKPAVPMKPVGINPNLLGYIGIDTIIEQMRKKTMKTGFDFNIMVVDGRWWLPSQFPAQSSCPKGAPGVVAEAEWGGPGGSDTPPCLGPSLRPLDLEFMKHLSKVVNIIPVIAKADTMTLEEKSEFKQRVRKELEVNGIEFYPQKEFDEDLEDKTENDKIRVVENLNHCEFALLRDFVIRTHLQDLKEVTHNIHYETYRAKRLNDNGGLPPGEGLLGTVLPPVPATPCPTAE